MIDWGGASRKFFVLGFGMSLISMEGELLAEHEAGLMELFCDEYAKEGGPRVDPGRLLKEFRLSRASSIQGGAGLLSSTVYPEISPEVWTTIESKTDPRALSHWEARCFFLQVFNDVIYHQRHWKSGFNLREYIEAWKREETMT